MTGIVGGAQLPIDAHIRSGSYEDTIGPLLCGRCKSAQLIREGNVKTDVTADARIEDELNHLDFEQISYWFRCGFICSNYLCRETVYCHGVCWNDYASASNRHEVTTTYVPTHFTTAPALILYPGKTPKPVIEELDKAQELLWCDPSSCTNRIRVALERMLDDLKVKKTYINNKGKRKALTLHARLDLWKSNSPELAQIGFATKWLGNTASHQEIDRDGACDAFDFVEHLIHEVYGQRTKQFLKKVKIVNATKGRRK